ncbi:MAG TPA: ChaN family lipoprotein [Bdellovibrionales bacterium]|nr:ChaN family lipoprotein [Bdellovibrionales bacterium]
MSNQVRVIDHRVQLLKQIKSWVRAYLGPEPGSLKKYSKPYQKEFTGKWRPSDAHELTYEILKSEIIYGGDFHGFSQAQRTHLRILRALPPRHEVVLALEIFETRYQRHVDAYMHGRLSEEKFLAAVKWKSRWGFPWTHYRPLLELAKKRGWKVIALNRHFERQSNATLHKRDLHAAKILAGLLKPGSGALVYVVFGDLHLASAHLPRLVGKSMRRRTRSIYLYQDSERLYFDLAKRGLETSVHVVRKGPRFCVLSAPPWVKWQSYLLFLEGNLDRDLENEDVEVDLTAHVRHFIAILAHDLGFELKPSDIAAYGPGDEALPVNLKKRLKPADFRVAKQLRELGKSFYVPGGGLFYLASPTVNHAATLAGEYIQAYLSGRTRTAWNMPRDFRRLVWIETLGFFLSKLINHRRKPDRLQQIRARTPALARDVLMLVLKTRIESLSLKFTKELRPKTVRPRQKSSYFLAAKMLGSLFGNSLHSAFRAGFVRRQDVLDWLSVDIDDPEFLDTYYGVLKRLEEVPERVKRSEKGLG